MTSVWPDVGRTWPVARTSDGFRAGAGYKEHRKLIGWFFGQLCRASPSAIWLRAELATHKNRIRVMDTPHDTINTGRPAISQRSAAALPINKLASGFWPRLPTTINDASCSLA